MNKKSISLIFWAIICTSINLTDNDPYYHCRDFLCLHVETDQKKYNIDDPINLDIRIINKSNSYFMVSFLQLYGTLIAV